MNNTISAIICLCMLRWFAFGCILRCRFFLLLKCIWQFFPEYYWVICEMKIGFDVIQSSLVFRISVCIQEYILRMRIMYKADALISYSILMPNKIDGLSFEHRSSVSGSSLSNKQSSKQITWLSVDLSRVIAGVTKMKSLLFQLILTSFVLLNSDNNVNAGITSVFIRMEYPSKDIPLDNEAFAVPTGHNAPQQVHITQGDYDGKAVIISWVTADEPEASKVQYGTSKGKYEFTVEGKMTNYTFYKYKSGYIHHVLVDDLEYDTKYYYQIGTGDSAREFWFQTPPKIGPDVPYKFGIIGDLGQTYNSLSTLEHYMESGAETVLFVGDLSYADRYQYNDVGIRWDSWGRFVERSTAYQPWIWSAGNHEIEYFPYMDEVVPFKSYLQRYPTPHLACKSSSPMWYAVRRASAHIIVLSSYSPFVKYTPQWEWLREELKRVDREKTPWLIVLMHVPIYNSNDVHFMEGESMRAVFEEWFVHHKVDIVFAGHVHAYERSYRISNIRYNVSSGDRYPVPDKSAPVYITVGDGGNQEGLAGRFRDPQPEYSAFREASYGHSTLEIRNRTHAFYHWNRNDDGKKVPTDSFVLHNQYWSSSSRRRKLKKQHSRSALGQIASY